MPEFCITAVNTAIVINSLTHCELVTSYDDMDLGQQGPGNRLLPDGAKPLPEPMMINQQ